MKASVVLSLLASFAALASAAALPEAAVETVAESENALEERGTKYFTWWTADGFQGTRGQKAEPKRGHCYNFDPAFNDVISSVGPSKGLQCWLYIDNNCIGGKLGPIRNPGYPKLSVYNFNDKASSYKCTYY